MRRAAVHVYRATRQDPQELEECPRPPAPRGLGAPAPRASATTGRMYTYRFIQKSKKNNLASTDR